MAEVVRSLKDCEDSLRDLSHELRPMVLENLGLMPALRNLAEKLARRNKLSISVSASGQDDGVGLSKPLRREESTGLGLIGMRERLSALGGSFRIASCPRGGTTLLLVVPLRP
jgi:signal transduction histidine kinase